jgi:succinyl-diaminopimelate desuccinylase
VQHRGHGEDATDGEGDEDTHDTWSGHGHGYGCRVTLDPTFLPAPAVAPDLQLQADVISVLTAIVDIRSVSHEEQALADAVERALSSYDHLEVLRDGNSVVARTNLGRPQRVIVAGHLDTVPEASNLPSRRITVDGEERVYGLGACDMKGGVAIALQLAATEPEPTRDVTWVFYEAEEVEAVHNGLRRISREHPDWLEGDFAVVMEPSNAGIEAGCQGTMRIEVRTFGKRSHSARPWMGDNAIHKLAEPLERLRRYQPRRVDVDGLEYREGLNAVGVSGGVAGNVIPDEAVLTVNYRYAPTQSGVEAEAHLREVFEGYDVTVVDFVDGAVPGLSQPAARAFVRAVDATPAPKFGWTDVALFSSLGVPAVNYGPGDPQLAHTRDEYTPVELVRQVESGLRAWLTG